jgi:polysaccharide biosynthesis protein PslH
LRQEAGVDVTGTVPDVRPYYRDALASIVPLRTGGGTRLKILEAMAAGVPVVSSPLGAEGLMVEHGANILLADPDDAGAWIQALTLLAGDSARREQLAGAARALVREHYDWTMVGRSLWQAYREWLA